MYKVKVILEAGDQEVMRVIKFEDGKMANEVYNAVNAALGNEAQIARENARFKTDEN